MHGADGKAVLARMDELEESMRSTKVRFQTMEDRLFAMGVAAGKPQSQFSASGQSKAFGMSLLFIQAVFLAVFWLASAKHVSEGETAAFGETQRVFYNFYIGVSCMMFVGFGYLMTFLKSYALGAVGFTMYITCLGVQFVMLAETYMGTQKLELDFASVLNGNFGVAAVLISFGGLIGKLSPPQVTVLVLAELFFYSGNKVFVLHQYAQSPAFVDCGGTVIIHVFGAYFGIACCKALGPPSDPKDLNGSSYTSDIFSLVGTVFLWLFWPSFVAGALTDGEQRFAALVNTVLALLASTVVTFALAPLLEASGKLTTVPIQNATLAGGVSIGATANLVGPFGALVVGATAGALSTWGFVKGPFFSDVDTCGINNLHGMPGVLGGLVSVAVPYLYKMDDPHGKAMSQAAGLGATLAVACVAGSFTGLVLKDMTPVSAAFEDEVFWECQEN